MNAFVIKEGQDQQLEGKILSHSTVSAEDEQLLQTVLSQIQSQMRAAQMDLTPKQLADLQAQSKVSSEVVSTSSDGSSLSPSQQALNSIIINGGVFLMFSSSLITAAKSAWKLLLRKHPVSLK